MMLSNVGQNSDAPLSNTLTQTTDETSVSEECDSMTLERVESVDSRRRVDAYISAHPAATPYHDSAWLNAVHSAYGLPSETLYLQQGDKVVAVLNRASMPRLMGAKSYCSLPYCDIGGVLADSDELAEKLWQGSMSLGQSNAQHLRREGLNQPLEADELKKIESDAASVKARLILPLSRTSDEMLASFKSKLRSQIRKSEKNGVRCEVSNDLDGFYAVMQKNMHRLGSPCHPKSWFRSVLDAYGDRSRLFVAKF